MADVFIFKVSLDYVHIMLSYRAKSTAKFVKWVGSFGGAFQIVGFVLVATFLARYWNLHFIVSHVVGAIVGVS